MSVRLTKIYTKTGDDGTTGLVNGQRVRKDDTRVDAYGTVDESNSVIGLAILSADHTSVEMTHMGDKTPRAQRAAAISAILSHIQHDLFDLGADLATPRVETEDPRLALRILPTQTAQLESWIDKYNEPLAPLNSFVVPGGTQLSAHLHVARTVVRRAERLAVTLQMQDGPGTNPEAVRYLNRLSDLLFVLCRVANDNGKRDVLWVPGKNRVPKQ
jgi:cob(I)alamin adenosyltransferase